MEGIGAIYAAAADGRLIAYGPGAAVRVNLETWRQGVRVQQIAFELAKVLTQKWKADRGEAIPVHRLFPQMLDIATRFIAEHVTPHHQAWEAAGEVPRALWHEAGRLGLLCCGS